ncbi:MAG: hypothetical protein OFPI_24060 [Osedax symbiont Rs2]|nr:MAG: hypothetical protein OFPI_24060 [Osedax symbiont Rs2]
MQMIKRYLQLIAVSLSLTACAIGAPDPNEISAAEKAKKHTDVAISYYQQGDNVGARLWVQKALGYDKNYGRAYVVLGSIFQSEKETQLAEKYFKKAIKTDPDSAMFHNNYGAFLYSQQQYQQACAELELATKDPFYNKRAAALDNLGRCYQQLEDGQQADKAFQRSVNLGGKSAFALINLSKNLLAAGETFKSNAKYSEFLQLVTDNQAHHTAESLILGIDLARKNGDTSEVVTYLLLLENLFPNKYKEYKESAQ